MRSPNVTLHLQHLLSVTGQASLLFFLFPSGLSLRIVLRHTLFISHRPSGKLAITADCSIILALTVSARVMCSHFLFRFLQTIALLGGTFLQL